MKTIYNQDRTAIQITGDYSPHSICAMADVVAALGGPEPVYHEIKRLANTNRLPWHGSEAHPLTQRDMRYARENEAMGKRHWRWFNLQNGNVKRDTGYDFVYGYGYEENGFVTLVNASDEPVFVVEMPQ